MTRNKCKKYYMLEKINQKYLVKSTYCKKVIACIIFPFKKLRSFYCNFILIRSLPDRSLIIFRSSYIDHLRSILSRLIALLNIYNIYNIYKTLINIIYLKKYVKIYKNIFTI